MSLTNPNTVVTEQRLNDFYKGILPYLGGSADAGFTPVGSVIAIMGVTAPANYLACDGTVYNISDYPELANYFYQQFGSKNKFGGDGTTTFAVPDLRGEFLRGTGSNSHENQGDGADVGTHQDGTEHAFIGINQDAQGTNIWVQTQGRNYGNDSLASIKVDKSIFNSNTTGHWYGPAGGSFSGSGYMSFTARPTNTSILWCIATKNIYLNPANDYSTDEKIVGTWIDGSPVYQKTFNGSYSIGSNPVVIDAIQVTDVDKLISEEFVTDGGTSGSRYVFTPSLAGFTNENKLRCAIVGSDTRTINMITLRYTKTN